MSQLVIFDMEWNMGYRPKTFVYEGAEQILRGEIIEIGAVKMEGQEIRDTFQVKLRPRIFKKLHHHVAKVTGLTQKDLDDGLPLAEGLRTFRAWCGEDAVLGEWGLDDIPVLKQNLFLMGLDESWPRRWCDLQRMYCAQHPPKEGEGMSLEATVERLGIEKDESFHDALSDALYTAKVMQRVDLARGLAEYPDEEAQLRELLCTPERPRQDFTSWKGLVDGEAWCKSREIRTAVCPECGRPLRPDADDFWLELGKNCRCSLGRCEEHGPVMVWLRRSRLDGLHYRFARATERPSKEAQDKWSHRKRSAIEHARRKQQQAMDQAAPRRKNTPIT